MWCTILLFSISSDAYFTLNVNDFIGWQNVIGYFFINVFIDFKLKEVNVRVHKQAMVWLLCSVI